MKRNQEHNNNEAVISISNLHKSFEDNHVLNGIDLDLHKGENVIVMGRSGSGKSVLIKIIIGLMKPDEGTVTVLGEKIHELDSKELISLRLKIGFLFQHNALYDSMTVRENLEFPLVRNARDMSTGKVNERVDDVLDAVGLGF